MRMQIGKLCLHLDGRERRCHPDGDPWKLVFLIITSTIWYTHIYIIICDMSYTSVYLQLLDSLNRLCLGPFPTFSIPPSASPWSHPKFHRPQQGDQTVGPFLLQIHSIEQLLQCPEHGLTKQPAKSQVQTTEITWQNSDGCWWGLLERNNCKAG